MSVLEAAIGWLAPPDCLVCGAEGDALCQNCSNSVVLPFGERCWRCNALSPNSRTCVKCRPVGPLNHVWVTTNYETAAQQLVQMYKFGHLRAAANPIARMMNDTILLTNTPENIAEREYLAVPLPTATSRVRQRGFGHSELLAHTIARKLRTDYSNSLRRLGQTRQLGSGRDVRLAQLAGSFAAKRPSRITGRNILLIDDVLTTGGSLIAAAKALKAAGAKSIDALVFAKRL